MKSEDIKKLTSGAVEQLHRALDAGHSETLKLYLSAMARFRAYPMLNILLILKQCPRASRVAGYRTWQSFGRQVNHGERGIMILAPIFGKRAELPESELIPEKSRPIVTYRAVYVWDETQTNGKPLPEIGQVTGKPSEHLQNLETFVTASGRALEYSTDIAPARGTAQKGKITLLPGLSAAETFATLVHEQAHAMLHQSDRPAETTKRIRETEAEAVAFVVCHAIGLDTGTAAADYVALYGGNTELLLASLEHIQRTATAILEAIQVQPQQLAA